MSIHIFRPVSSTQPSTYELRTFTTFSTFEVQYLKCYALQKERLQGLIWQNETKRNNVKPWPNGLASRHKSTQVNARLAYGLAKGGQTDSQVGSQVAKRCKFHARGLKCVFITTDYLRSTCVDLRWVAKR